ncbi:hypothetical protein ACHQM5_025757 [Ranunculus cassubicifolius]
MDALAVNKAAYISSPILYCGAPIETGTKPSVARLQVRALGRNPSSSTISNSNGDHFSFTTPLTQFWQQEVGDQNVIEKEIDVKRRRRSNDDGNTNTNWVVKILRIRSVWKQNQDEPVVVFQNNGGESQEEAMLPHFDRDSFSRLLTPVSLPNAELYARLSYLGSLAYSIPNIKPENLVKYHRLRYVTSSIDKKAQSLKQETEETSTQGQQSEENPEEVVKDRNISAATAYRIAASAASYLRSHTGTILPFRSSSKNETGDDLSEMSSFVVATNSLTAVVAAKEEMKQTVGKDFNSVHSSPCDWFICDDDQNGTRIFVIQGSETLASWQANLLFEPVQFEGLDVFVHRGIYEAAKGIYEQILPEVRSHLQCHGNSATMRFTGHSLGGSLSMLINLMLIIRGEVAVSGLLPAITFGSPTIMCGGDQLLRRLGLPRNHVQAITMHRDIVPRAFSCNYPDRVINILRAVSANFRNHPCLKSKKLMYAPTGEMVILQPDEKISPHHHLLPSGNGLYILRCPKDVEEKQVEAAQSVFLNSPHPLDILSDKSSYGSGGTIYRDHDMKAYLRSLRRIIRQERNRRKEQKRQQLHMLLSLVNPQGIYAGGIKIGRQLVSFNLNIIGEKQFPPISRILQKGEKSFKWFSKLVTSHHMHLLFVLFFPARLLMIGFHAIFSSHY